MRLLAYNIRYATGTGPAFHLPLPGAGYLRSSRRVLDDITHFIRREDPDLVGLIEVDTGSVRSGLINQAEYIAQHLGHYTAYECKYGAASINNQLPIVRKQGNAILAAPRVTNERFHYFPTGIKRLVIEMELDEVCIFLVHLSIKYRHRQEQLRHLHDLILTTQKPVVVAGDFNTFSGTNELFLFMRATGLRSANTLGMPSFPARIPRAELDFVLVSREIEVLDFRIPDVRFSDHRPIVCDFRVLSAAEIDARERHPAPLLA
ncbi:MAG: endonuclease [Gammaproteobacteria bacterium]|nr:endonuclease [Gammaproteobacteria bacterium]